MGRALELLRTKASARPLIALAVAVALGTTAARALSPSAWAIASLALIAVAAWPRMRSARVACVLAAILASTAWRAGAVAPVAPRPQHADRAPDDPRRPRSIGAWRRESVWGDREVGRVGGSHERFELRVGLVREGERVAILARGAAPVPARGPVPGPAERAGRAPPVEVGVEDLVRVAPRPTGAATWISTRVEELRAELVARARTIRDPTAAGLVAALLFGDTSGLDVEIPDLFVRTGTYHVLAISGLQVAMAAGLLVWPLGTLLARVISVVSRGRARVGAPAVRVMLLALFVPIAGAGAPVVRAAIAWAIGSLAPSSPRRDAACAGVVLGRAVDPLSLWALALIAEALARPERFGSLSLQLSYAATAGLIGATGRVRRTLRGALRGGAVLAPVDALGRARSPWWRVPLQRALDVGVTALAASCAAVLATLPWMWDRFGEWSPVGWIATPLCALPTFALMAVGWCRIAFDCAPLELLLEVLADGLIGLLRALDGVPGSPCLLPPRPLSLLALACFGALAIAGSRASPRATRAVAALWGVLLLPWTARPAGFEIAALDVGGGTAVVWRAPTAGTWLFDAGSRDRPDVARQAVMPLLAAWDARSISIALSHSDRDHDGALPFVAERLAIDAWLGAVPAQGGERFPHTSAALDVAVGRARVIFGARAAPPIEVSIDRPSDVAGNEGSRTLRVRWLGEEIVLCGDAEAEGLARWLAHDVPRKPVRLLLLPHHGSEGPHFGELLRRTRPREVWVSAGGELDVARELDRTRVAWRWTARDGPLELAIAAPAAAPDAARERP